MGAKLVKVRAAVSSRRRSLDLTLKGWELRGPRVCRPCVFDGRCGAGSKWMAGRPLTGQGKARAGAGSSRPVTSWTLVRQQEEKGTALSSGPLEAFSF